MKIGKPKATCIKVSIVELLGSEYKRSKHIQLYETTFTDVLSLITTAIRKETEKPS